MQIWQYFFLFIGAVIQRCSVKKVFLEISQNSQENTCARDFLIKLPAWGNFIYIYIYTYVYIWRLFFKKDTFKYTTISQWLTFNSFSWFYIFCPIVFFTIISFQTLMYNEKSHLESISHMYTLSFCYVMYYIMSEICIGERSLGYCFCYSQQIIYAVANEYLIPYDLIKRAPETQKL